VTTNHAQGLRQANDGEVVKKKLGKRHRYDADRQANDGNNRNSTYSVTHYLA